MPERPAFQQVQYRFAAHIRDPQKNPRPEDVEDRRMAIYRDLFFNNIDGFLSSGFPVLRQLYDDSQWLGMVRDFYTRHQSHTPFFAEIAQEFLKYLQDERGSQPEDPPFLFELAHYEWVELALSIADDELDFEHIDPDGDLLQGVPALSPLSWLLVYSYPVHRIGPEFRPQSPGDEPTQIVVYRNLEDKVGFMLVNPVTARLITLIGEQPQATGAELLDQIARELSHPRPEVVREGGFKTLCDLRAVDIVLGTRRPN